MLKISVIVPIYNVANLLPFCIESILKQTHKNLEIILIDDGSTDNSLSICKNYANQDNRIKVIHQENHGLSHARNIGIKNATSKYIGFVDSDDIIFPYFYEHLLNLIITNNADIAECSFVKIDESNIVDYVFPPTDTSNIGIFNSIASLHRIHNEDLDICVKSIVVWNKLYKTSLFDNINFPIGKHHEDEFTTYKLFYASKKLVSSNATLYGYVQRKSSIMNQTFTMNRLHALEAYDNYLAFFKTLHDSKLIEKCERRYLRLLVKILTELEYSNFYDKDSIRKLLKEKFDNICDYNNLPKNYILNPSNILQSKSYYYDEFYKILNGGKI